MASINPKPQGRDLLHTVESLVQMKVRYQFCDIGLQLRQLTHADFLQDGNPVVWVDESPGTRQFLYRGDNFEEAVAHELEHLRLWPLVIPA
jgi:hypothetical protein